MKGELDVDEHTGRDSVKGDQDMEEHTGRDRAKGDQDVDEHPGRDSTKGDKDLDEHPGRDSAKGDQDVGEHPGRDSIHSHQEAISDLWDPFLRLTGDETDNVTIDTAESIGTNITELLAEGSFPDQDIEWIQRQTQTQDTGADNSSKEIVNADVSCDMLKGYNFLPSSVPAQLKS